MAAMMLNSITTIKIVWLTGADGISTECATPTTHFMRSADKQSENHGRSRPLISELCLETCEMYLVITVTLITALMVLLILGFLRVARELLSRSIYETPPCPNESNSDRVEHESRHWTPWMVKYGGEPSTCSPNNPLSDSFMETLASLHQEIERQNSRPRT